MTVTTAPKQAAQINRWGMPLQVSTTPTPIAMATLMKTPMTNTVA
jgi:hypothetical protein